MWVLTEEGKILRDIILGYLPERQQDINTVTESLIVLGFVLTHHEGVMSGNLVIHNSIVAKYKER